MKKFSDIKIKTKKEENFFKINEKREFTTVNESKKTPVVKFISKLFESREMAHIYHLQVKGDMGSHGKHLALGEYYEKIIDMIDEIVEIYQGQYDLIKEYDVIDTSSTSKKEPLEYFKDLAIFIKKEKKCFNVEDTHYYNLIDNIVGLIYLTIYKLKFTK